MSMSLNMDSLEKIYHKNISKSAIYMRNETPI